MLSMTWHLKFVLISESGYVYRWNKDVQALIILKLSNGVYMFMILFSLFLDIWKYHNIKLTRMLCAQHCSILVTVSEIIKFIQNIFS